MVQIAVALKNSEWTIFRNGQSLIGGLSRSRAIEDAEELAAEARAEGDEVELLIQDYIGELKRRT
jgi:hypothetical protein